MDYATLAEAAVKQFYEAGNNDAHSWLLQVQAAPEAWSFSWQLLDPSKSWEVQFFAATTLYIKISKQWDEVPKNEYAVLKERLLSSMKHPNVPHFVLSKLCQSLAAFMANSNDIEDRENDKSLVDELITILPYDSLPALELLLRVLSLLPIEYEKRQINRAKLREALVNSWGKTTWLLQQVFLICNPNIEGYDGSLHLLGIECVLSWLKIGQLPLETTGQIYPHLLVAASYYAPNRNSHEDHTRNWEIIQECLIIIVTHCNLHKKPQTLWEWTTNLITMAQQHNEKYFCEVLTAIGETHSRIFLIALTGNNDTQIWTVRTLIELLLECSEQEGNYPIDEMRSSIPFGFWYALQDDLSTLDQPIEKHALLALKPVYARLAQALLRKSTLPISPAEEGDADERELFRCYRQDIADTLDYCYNVLGDDLLVLLGQRLSRPLKIFEEWVEIESTLHAFKALAESIGTQEIQYIPALMNLVLSLSYELYPAEVLACACSTLGAYAEWIGEHPDPWLEKALHLVTLGLTTGSLTASFATMALKDLARECNPHLAPFAPAMLNTIGQTLPNVAPGSGEGLRLIFAAGKLLMALPSVDDQLLYVDLTIGLCITRIRQSLEQPLFAAKAVVTNQLKMITTFFTTLDGFIGKTVLESLIPMFNKIITHPEWSQDNDTLEAMYVCAQRSLSSLLYPQTEALPLLPILTTSYKTWPHPAALRLLRQFVLLLGREPDNIIRPIFAEMSSITLNGVKACQSVQGDLSDWSDLLEAYLGVLAYVCKKNVRMLLQMPDQILEMLQCGITCLTLPETATAKAAGNFLYHAIMQNVHLQMFIQPIGQELVSVILHCIGTMPFNNLEPHAEVLLGLNRACADWTAQWLRIALENHTGPVTTIQKRHFISSVLREKVNRGRLHETLKEFSINNKMGL